MDLIFFLMVAGGLYWAWRKFFAAAKPAVPAEDDIGTGAHGSARFTTPSEMRRAGLISSDRQGVVIGRSAEAQGAEVISPALGSSFDHVLVVSPPGKGKGVGIVQPTLLRYQGSCVVLDPKGENFSKCAGALSANGVDVKVIDPWGMTGFLSSSINPLAGLDKDDPNLKDDCKTVAEALVTRTSPESAHWDDQTVTVLAAVIAAVVVADGRRASLSTVRRLLTAGPESFEGLVADMGADAHPLMRSSAGVLKGMMRSEKEWSIVFNGALKATEFLDSPAIASSLGETTFQAGSMRSRDIALFLVLPAERMKAFSGLVRLWVQSIITPILRAGDAPKDRPPIHFVLDEVFSRDLGRIEALETQLTLMRGYGLRMVLVAQALGQIRGLYGADGCDAILAATGTKAFFGVADQDTAEYVSKMLGTTTIEVQSTSRSNSSSGTFGSGGSSASDSVSTSLIGRPLLTPDEVRRLPETVVLGFAAGLPPLRLERITSFRDAEYSGRLGMAIGSAPARRVSSGNKWAAAAAEARSRSA